MKDNDSKKMSIFGHMVKLHDVTHNFSDDADASKLGATQYEIIQEFYNALKGEEKRQARLIWNKHIDTTIDKRFVSQFYWGA